MLNNFNGEISTILTGFLILSWCHLVILYRTWLAYGSYIPVNNKILTDKMIVPTNSNPLLTILLFFSRKKKPNKIKRIALGINTIPKPIFKYSQLLHGTYYHTFLVVSSYNENYRYVQKGTNPSHL